MYWPKTHFFLFYLLLLSELTLGNNSANEGSQIPDPNIRVHRDVKFCPTAFAGLANEGFYDSLEQAEKSRKTYRRHVRASGLANCPELELIRPLFPFITRVGLETMVKKAGEYEKDLDGRFNFPGESEVALFRGALSIEKERPRRRKDDSDLKFLIIGGGEGREVDWLLKHVPNPQIQVIERASEFTKFLKNKYSDEPKVKIHQRDFFKIDGEFVESTLGLSDVVVLSYSVIFDLRTQDPLGEGQSIFPILNSVAAPQSLIVVESNQETPPKSPKKLQKMDKHGETVAVIHGLHVNYIEIIPFKTIAALASNAGFLPASTPLIYQPTKGHYRMVQLFTKDPESNTRN